MALHFHNHSFIIVRVDAKTNWNIVKKSNFLDKINVLFLDIINKSNIYSLIIKNKIK